MKKITFILICLFQFTIVFGQTELESAKAYFDQGTAAGYKNAILIYSKNETKLSASQINTLGFSYWKLEDYKPALKYFELAASKGDETGKFNSGYNYFNGNGTEVDYQKAYNYLARVSDEYSGLPETLHMLGHCVEAGADLHGTLGKPNYFGAKAYFLSASQKGHVASMIHLADYFNNSGKIEANYNEAKSWYEKACDLKDDDACKKLASLNKTLASLSQPKQEQNEVTTTVTKKKGGGFLKVLGAINDGLSTYNNAKSSKVNSSNGELSNGGMSKTNKQWSEWRSCPSFKKIQYSVIYDGPYDVGKSDLHYWRVKIKNLYSVPVYGGFTIGTSISDLKDIYFYGSEKESKGGSITIYLKAYEISGSNEIRIKSSSNIMVDVVQLGYSPEGGTKKLRTDNGDVCMRCKLYPTEKGCE